MSEWHVEPVSGSGDTFAIADVGEDKLCASVVTGCDEYGCGVHDRETADQIVREHNAHGDLLAACEAGWNALDKACRECVCELGGEECAEATDCLTPWVKIKLEAAIKLAERTKEATT